MAVVIMMVLVTMSSGNPFGGNGDYEGATVVL